jgi:hypothetical protein
LELFSWHVPNYVIVWIDEIPLERLETYNLSLNFKLSCTELVWANARPPEI